MKILKVGAACVVALAMSSCAGFYTAPVIPSLGFIYADYKAPIDTNAEGTPIKGLKQGSTTSKSYVGLVALGDASINTAAQNGGIEKIEHVDYQFFNVLGCYSKFTTNVYGE